MKCKQCGACCSELIIEIEHVDVVREPKLLDIAKHLACGVGDDGEYEYPEDKWDRQYRLGTATKSCEMLKNNKCSIYPTRPNLCVSFEAGSEQCLAARETKHG